MSDNHRKMNVVFASAEAAPFVKTGGLGDVAGSLPAALQKAGANVIVMVPLYGTISDEYKNKMEHVAEFYVSLGWRNEYCGLERLVHNGVTYLFVDNKRYFDRDYPYGFFDDGERFAFFSKAITESLQYLPDGFRPDILHCNDWHTALAPVFLREFYQGMPLYENVSTIFSIHNIAFQGQFSAKVLEDICGLAHIPAAAFQLTCGHDAVNFMQGALNYSDAITTVSPTYAGEIQTPAYGEHLDGVLRRRREALQGIVNGIDTDHFNPETDPAIAQNFSVSDRSGKAICKAKLQEELGLTVRDDQPLMTMVTRLTRQKGMDLVTYALDRILSNGVQVAVLGTGDYEYENALRYFASKYPGQMAARIQFDPALSQRMYAGSDMFLMPSLFEPCGLSQMIAMRYGTLPVVRETGGLKDTVIPYNYETGEGTGFSFANFNGDEMGDAVFRGARLFWDNHDAWNNVVTQAMNQDFSWTRSASKYMDLYRWMHPEVPVWVPELKEKTEEIVEEPKTEEATAEHPKAEEVKAPEAEAPAAKPAPAKKAAPRKTAAKKPATKPAAEAVGAAKEEIPSAKKPAAKAAKPASKKCSAAATAAEAAEPVAKKPAVKTAAAKTVARAVAETPAKPAAAKAATSKSTAAKATASKAATTTKAATKATAAKSKAAKTTATKAATATKTAAAKTATAKTIAAKPAAEEAAPAVKPSAKAGMKAEEPKAPSSSVKTAAAATKAAAKPESKSAATPAAEKKPAAKTVSSARKTQKRR
ncbi:glycogen synthase GlgA [Collinsella sp. UBA1693]|uniref:glycogen synthase GlgA n=1 Tax=Collinsella sp. UBA1693 TaxID=1946385 RepID=UPI00257DC6BD|nr:glycogen synthase GlgA [Collinsella sp. UBA1693]